jgi:hypothetical protein
MKDFKNTNEICSDIESTYFCQLNKKMTIVHGVGEKRPSSRDI